MCVANQIKSNHPPSHACAGAVGSVVQPVLSWTYYLYVTLPWTVASRSWGLAHAAATQGTEWTMGLLDE